MEHPSLTALAQTLAGLVADYRQGESTNQVSAKRVLEWVSQLETNEQEIILSEMVSILERFYLSRVRVKHELEILINETLFRGRDPAATLETLCFLDIQMKGSSQRDLLEVVEEILGESYGLSLEACAGAEARRFVYLDDAVYT